MELHIYRDDGPGGVTYRAECGRFVSRIEQPPPHPVSNVDAIAVGQIIRSKWMDMVFAAYKRVKVVIHFELGE